MIKKPLIKLMGKERKHIGLWVLWQWISLCCQIAACFILGNTIDDFQKNGGSYRQLAFLAAVFAIVIGMRIICEKISSYHGFRASSAVKPILRKRIYSKVLKLGASYREKVATSQLLQLTTEGIEQLEVYFGRYLPQFFYSLAAPITLFVALCTISLKVSLILLLSVPLIPISIVAVMKIAKRLLRKYWAIYTGLGDSFLENLQGLTTLKIYGADEMKAIEMDREAEHFRRITMKVLTMQLNSTSVMDIIAYGGAAGGIFAAIWEFHAGNIELYQAVVIILLSGEFFIPLRLLGSYFHIAMNGMAASDRLFEILEAKEDEKEVVSPHLKAEPERNDRGEERLSSGDRKGCLNADCTADLNTQNAKNFAQGDLRNAAVRIEGLSFSYDGEKEALKDVCISGEVGSVIGIVGSSGSGKSTFAKLLSGKYRNYKGEILIDGEDMKSMSGESINFRVGVISFNSHIFKGSVRENLLMAREDVSDETMKNVLKSVELWEFLEGLDGLDTEIKEGGKNFSGGQRQRLALARGLIAKRDVYVFDEATSNIDMESEEIIMEHIYKLGKEKTVFLISHRLANVEDADKIYLFSNGAVSEEGSHEELMKAGGIYREMYCSQREIEAYGEK